MKKKYKYFALFSVSVASIILLCLVLILTGNATPFISCFAVDAMDQIYIGIQNEIRVYADDKLVNTISPKTSRSYMFTIDKEKILLSTSVKLYLLDLEGTVLDVQEDAGADMYNKLQYNKRVFISPKGDNYQLVGEFGWTRIVKNDNETVFQISLLSFVVKIAIAVCAILLFAVPIYVLVRRYIQ